MKSPVTVIIGNGEASFGPDICHFVYVWKEIALCDVCLFIGDWDAKKIGVIGNQILFVWKKSLKLK